MDPTLDILNQLLKYTEQLARSASDVSVDVSALARACESRIRELGTPLAGGGGVSPEARTLVTTLVARTESSIGVIEECIRRTGDELAFLRTARTAIRAYEPTGTRAG